jgi:MoxR-like ATPase
MADVTVHPECPFSGETFNLLAQLEQDFYIAHEEEFKKYVEQPLQELCCQVAAQLPGEIIKRIDMKLDVAPNFLWKNFEIKLYHKETNFSITNAHLFINLIQNEFRFGLFIINGTLDKQRFIQNSQKNPIKEIIFQNTRLPEKCTLHFSSSDKNKNLDLANRLGDWLRLLARQNNPTKNIQASVHFEPNEVLLLSNEELTAQINQAFEGFFPLFLMAVCDDPITAIRNYLNPNYKIYAREEAQRILKTIQPDYSEPSFTEISQSVRSKGLRMAERTLRRYHLALKTRKFVILSGISGTGKTWLTKAYADAVEAKYLSVPVAPNWTTNEDLLGYLNPITDEEYHYTDFSRFLEEAEKEYKQAQEEKRTPKPYHLVLDEMNLARVEYYFAKFLSAMEVRMREGEAKIELAPDKQVSLPPNLYFIGTVNMDETTQGFAEKVYDRAQLIELEVAREDLDEHLGEVPYREILMNIWDSVHAVAPFAFRVLDEIKAYVEEAEKLKEAESSERLDDVWKEALDEQLLQKILPKLKGADERVGEALKEFVEIADNQGFELSREKAAAMLETFNKHGFTSYF